MLVEGEGHARDFPLMIHQLEGLTQLVFLYQFVDEGNRTDALVHGLNRFWKPPLTRIFDFD